MAKNRPSPMKTAKATIARAYRREEAVQLHFRDGLTLREAAERLGVSHETVWRDAAASIKDAETRQLAAWYGDKLIASHLEHMESVRATAPANDFGAGGGSAAAERSISRPQRKMAGFLTDRRKTLHFQSAGKPH